MKYYLLLLGILGTCFALFVSSARGSVRTLSMNDGTMEPIRLSLGNSTVLRFMEKPERIVLGNKKFYRVEFVGTDVAIQPLGEATSNLFVYTKNASYGFILNSQSAGEYDDLVKIYRKKAKARYLLNEQNTLSSASLKVKLQSIKWPNQGMVAISLSVANKTNGPIETGKVRLFLSSGKGRISPQKTYFRDLRLKPHQAIEAQIVAIVPEKTQSFTLHLSFKNESAKTNIPRR